MKLRFDPSMNVSTWSPQTAVEKRNSVEKGYYEDDFIKHICPKTSQSPVLSFFDYTRVVGTRKVIEHFFNNFKDQKVQFVNLGCGMDSISLWVMANFPNCSCFDLDLEYQTKVKTSLIRESAHLLSLFPNHTHTESSFHSERYNLFPCDLKKVDELDKLKEYGFSSEVPTVYLSDFVLVYIENELSNKVIHRLTTMSESPSVFIYHEHNIPKGPIMTIGDELLEDHNTPVFTIYEYPTVESQIERYKSLGWDDVLVRFYTDVYNYMIDKSERIRLMKIENFDEFYTMGVYFSNTLFGICTKHLNEYSHFVRLFDIPENVQVDDDDRLVKHFTEDELEKADPEPIRLFVTNVFEVTYSTQSEELQRYYSRF